MTALVDELSTTTDARSGQRQVDPAVEAVHEQARLARVAGRALAAADGAARNRLLHAMADALRSGTQQVLRANATDLLVAADAGLPDAGLDRLRLDAGRVAAMADGLDLVAGLPDPVGEIVREIHRPNGLAIIQRRVPFGVVGVVYEGRPNVTTDAAGLCLKSGNAVLLRGSGSAAASNAAIVGVLRHAAVDAGFPADLVHLVDPGTRDSVRALLAARGLVDLLIPRGGAGLIARVVEQARVPVIETGVGNCHVYLDASADPELARRIVVDSKVSRPSVCNAAETLLVDAGAVATLLPPVAEALVERGVRLHVDERAGAFLPGLDVVAATPADFATEYLSLDMAVAVVAGVEGAIEHIRRFSTGHTEAIVAGDRAVAARFVGGVDAAAVMVNASTRFTDGERFGFGAEIGISTQKLHARGPLGLPELTTTTYVVTGTGQTVSDPG